MNLKNRPQRSRLKAAFEAQFGKPSGKAKALQCAVAPGRVNLIGEHTDYNGGLVLPMAIDRHTAVVFRPNGLKKIRVFSASVSRAGGLAEDRFGLTLKGIPRLKDPKYHWANYIRGVAAALLNRGYKLKAGDLYIENDLAAGAGLSSSASLEVAVALALQSLAGSRRLKPQDLAFAAQEAEHTYPGVKCGIMDQTIVARGKSGHALLLDCLNLNVKQIPIRLKGWSFAIFDTGVRHELAASEYNRRRAECSRAAKRFGVGTVREATLDSLLGKGDRLSASERKRVRHVLSEDLRTQQFAAELGSGDVAALGRFLHGSHASLRDDYQVSCKELDFLVEALSAPKLGSVVAGARMTGGGFGGAVVALIRTKAFKSIHAHLRQAYKKGAKRELGVALLVHPSDGAQLTKL